MPGLGFFGSAVGPPALRDLGAIGFWDTISSPVAAYYNGKTYITFERSNSHIYAAQYVHATNTLSTPVDLGTLTAADGPIHNAPAIMVRDSDKRIIVAAAEESASAQPGIWISTNAEDATAFGSVQLIPPSVAYPTYPSLVQLTAIGGQPIYYFIRIQFSGTWILGYFKSTDDGATWSAFTQLISPVSTTSAYYRIGGTASRIDIYTTDTNRVDSPSSVYHFVLDSSDNLRKTDGTLIGAASAGPYPASDGTLVKSASEGSARPTGWAFDGSGNPACLIMVESGGTTNLVRTATFASSWSVHDVVDTNGFVGSNVFVGSSAMSKTDPSTVYVPVKVSSHFELKRYVTTDGGATWTATALTTGSGSDNAMPDTPLHAGPGLLVLWGLGTYTSDSSFSFEMYGWGS